MSRASAILAKAARRNGFAMAALAFLAVAIVVAAAATGPYIFKGATLEGEVAAQLRASTGLRMASSGRASFSLMPSPHLELTDLHLEGPALVIDAGALEGDVRLLPLIVGRLELSAATLVRPKLTIDLDAGEMPTDSTIGRALHGLAPPADDAGARLGSVTLVDGTAELHAAALSHLPKLDEVDVTIDWPDIDSPATLTGSLMVDDVFTDVAAWVAQPSMLMRGETSPIALRLHAAPLDLSANGDLVSAGKTTFHGHMAMSAPSLPALLARFGDPTHPMAPFANAALKADTTVAFERDDRTSVDLQGLQLDLDGNRYEGTLAYESGDKPSLSGTLATETLTLAPFLAAEPSLADAQHRWTRSALVAGGGGGSLDLDLRLSATHLKVAPFTIDDAALSVMTRGPRTEVALNEGRAYGGAIKGRASVGVVDGIVSLRGAGMLDDADVAGLSWDLLGRQAAAGTLSGAVNIDTSGNSPAALMAHLQGWAKGRARDGELSGVDLGRGLRALDAGQGVAGLTTMRRGRTPFSSLVVALRLADGVATIEDAVMSGPDAAATATGTADIGRRGLALGITAAPPGSAPGARLAIGLEGWVDAPVVTPRVLAPQDAAPGGAKGLR